MNPYVFFVGCPRSGTTLLGRIGDAHPDLAVILETRWIVAFWEQRIGLTPTGDATAELRERLREQRPFVNGRMDVTALEMLMTDGVSYADFVSALFDRYGESRAKRIVGDKTPRYVLSLPTLNRLWPTAKFVHLIRDGRDVSLSVLDWRKGPRKFPTWQSDPISTLGLWWEWHVRLGREAGASLGDERYYELRYEALVADPERECQPLCDFLGLDYEPEMLRFHEGRTKSKPGLSAKKAWLPVTLGVRDWRAQMSTDDLSRFQAAAGDLLDELGYERPPVDVLEDQQARAARTRDAFEGHARAAGWRVPGAWENVPA